MLSDAQKLARFHTLARFFIDGYNPKPYNFRALLDCVLSLPLELIPDEASGRYFAHAFCEAVAFALSGSDPLKCPLDREAAVWIAKWVKEETPVGSRDEDE